MDKFVRTCECFDEKTCRVIIDLFENSQVKERIENAGVPTFTQVNINSSGKADKFMQLLCYKIVEVIKEYKKEK